MAITLFLPICEPRFGKDSQGIEHAGDETTQSKNQSRAPMLLIVFYSMVHGGRRASETFEPVAVKNLQIGRAPQMKDQAASRGLTGGWTKD